MLLGYGWRVSDFGLGFELVLFVVKCFKDSGLRLGLSGSLVWIHRACGFGFGLIVWGLGLGSRLQILGLSLEI